MRKIKTGDDVIVTAGRDKGRTGRVLKVLPDDRVIVENANLVKKHTRPDPNRGVAGGIVEKEAPMHVSNVMLYNPRSKKGDRVGLRTLDDGRKVRYFKSDNEVVDL
ncbi:MAG TPA: 50S ribosomal protein L24 [Gammaproteobacteria bacterium]|nr:50S ribosomal protein L24 [Gammaproteobacteria bacterium]